MFRFALPALAACCLSSAPLFAQEDAPFLPQEAATAMAAEAGRAAQAGDWEAARRALEGALALKPQHPAYLSGLVRIGLNTGDTDLIFETLERMAEAGIAVTLSNLGDADESLRVMQPDRYAALDAAMARLRSPEGEAEREATIAYDGLIEGLAMDIETDRLFLSSVSGREVLLVEPFDREAYSVFADADDGLQSVFGMAVDSRNRVLWVTTGVLPQTGLPEGETGDTALVALDLITGDVYRRYTIEGADRMADVAVRDGIVYVTDSGANRIYRLQTLNSDLELLSDDPRFASLQGLALAQGGLYVADYALGLWRVDLDDGAATLVRSGSESLIGIDGLGATRDGERLIAVRNGMNPHQVFAIDFAPRGHAVSGTEVLLRGHADFGEPTLVDVEDGRIWLVANSPWGLFPDDGTGPTGTIDPLVVLEIDLD